MDGPEGTRAVDQAEPTLPVGVERVGEGAGPIERLGHETTELPAREARLGRRRVDGDDSRVRDPVASPAASPAETRSTTGLVIWRRPGRCRACRRRALGSPAGSWRARHAWLKKTTRIAPVPSCTVSSTRALPLAGTPGMCGAHLRQDHRLVPDGQVPQIGLPGPVDVPARVVGQQVEHRGDAHGVERLGPLGRRPRRARRRRAPRVGGAAGLPSGSLDAEKVRVQGLAAVVDLGGNRGCSSWSHSVIRRVSAGGGSLALDDRDELVLVANQGAEQRARRRRRACLQRPPPPHGRGRSSRP